MTIDTKHLLLLLFITITFVSKAQVGGDTTSLTAEEKEKYVSLFNDDDPLFAEQPKAEENTDFEKKKWWRMNWYYGIKTKKGFNRTIRGRKEIIEVFYTPKKYHEPNPYIQELYWYDFTKMKMYHGSARKFKKEEHKLLHGPYLKRINGEIVEQGYFYLGSKHFRWEYYTTTKEYNFDKKKHVEDQETGEMKDTLIEASLEYNILLKKEEYLRGWPKDAEISYYDKGEKKIKEVIPYVGKIKEGDYYYFYEDGKVKEHGEYICGLKAGKWMEYFDGKRTHFRQKEYIYPRDPLTDKTEGYLSKEFDVNGHVLYDFEEEEKKKK